MAGYVYRGKGGDETHNPTSAMTTAQKDRLAVAVLRITTSLHASLVASQERRYWASQRAVCAVCGALYAGATCDVCRARMGAAA